MVINGFNYNSSIDLPYLENLTILKRENIGFDFGGWSVGLLENDFYKNYDKFLFINSSVVGPFIPPYFDKPWPELITSGLKGNIKLYGSTINNYDEYGRFQLGKSHHVQSFAFSLDKKGLDVCMHKNIFSLTIFQDSFINTVINCELGLSRVILEAGYNIGCCMKRYENTDFLNLQKYTRDHFAGDGMYNDSYTCFGLHPYETIFIKSNRGINPLIYNHYLLNKRVTYEE